MTWQTAPQACMQHCIASKHLTGAQSCKGATCSNSKQVPERHVEGWHQGRWGLGPVRHQARVNKPSRCQGQHIPAVLQGQTGFVGPGPSHCPAGPPAGPWLAAEGLPGRPPAWPLLGCQGRQAETPQPLLPGRLPGPLSASPGPKRQQDCTQQACLALDALYQVCLKLGLLTGICTLSAMCNAIYIPTAHNRGNLLSCAGCPVFGLVYSRWRLNDIE